MIRDDNKFTLVRSPASIFNHQIQHKHFCYINWLDKTVVATWKCVSNYIYYSDYILLFLNIFIYSS